MDGSSLITAIFQVTTPHNTIKPHLLTVSKKTLVKTPPPLVPGVSTNKFEQSLERHVNFININHNIESLGKQVAIPMDLDVENEALGGDSWDL